MKEATVVRWHCRPQDLFRKGQPLYEIETEKVTTEVQAPCDGRLVEIVVPAEQIVNVGDVVCHIDT